MALLFGGLFPMCPKVYSSRLVILASDQSHRNYF